MLTSALVHCLARSGAQFLSEEASPLGEMPLAASEQCPRECTFLIQPGNQPVVYS